MTSVSASSAQGLGDHEIQGTDLVAAKSHGKKIVALEPQRRAAERSRKSPRADDRRGLRRQRKTRQGVESGGPGGHGARLPGSISSTRSTSARHCPIWASTLEQAVDFLLASGSGECRCLSRWPRRKTVRRAAPRRTRAMNHMMRRLLADAASKRKHDPFRERIAAGGVQIGAHPVGAHFQPFEECGEQVHAPCPPPW